jgi:anion-transporting  ArsA/GET3 family ATPase
VGDDARRQAHLRRDRRAARPDAHAREEILANPVYRELSTAVAGSHELSAVAKLYELHEEHDFDVIVLDTPPSRNALDFLEAPSRLLGFLDGRALQVFLAPGADRASVRSGHGPRLLDLRPRDGRGHAGRAVGFFRSLGGVIDGFGERTRGRGGAAALARHTAFLIVTSPEREPAREAQFLADRLAEAGMARRGADRQPRARARPGRPLAQELAGAAAAGAAGRPAGRIRVASNLADFDVLVRRDRDVASCRDARARSRADNRRSAAR